MTGMLAELTLPLPPSVNALYVPQGRGQLVKSAAYRRWLRSCSTARYLPLLRVERGVPVWVEIAAGIDHRRDVDNLIKPVLDCLEQVGAFPDDRYVDVVRAARVPNVHGVRVKWGIIGAEGENDAAV